MVDSALPGPGDIVAGKYRIEREIGRGGMSAVFGATHDVTGKRFAIKWLLPNEEGVTLEDAAQRFIREAQVAGRFHHPNVVEVYDVSETNGSYYMVMEWLEGESLADRLEERGPFSFAEVCRYMIPAMQGVDEAHANGIVHRDLKPANIFVCYANKHSPEKTKVLDFGIAKLSSRASDLNPLVTKTGVLIGTPYYLSIEQLRNQPVDHRTDIYAFGVMLYQLLSCELPFPADNFGELVLQIATSTPRPLRSLVPGLPLEVEELVMRAMARDPSARFQDLRSMIGAMERINTETTAARTGSRRLPATQLRPSLETPWGTESSILPPVATQESPRSKLNGAYITAIVVLLGAVGWLVHSYVLREPVVAGSDSPIAAPVAAVENAATGVGALPAATTAHPPVTLDGTGVAPQLQAIEPLASPPQAASVTVPSGLANAGLSSANPTRVPDASRINPAIPPRPKPAAAHPPQTLPQPAVRNDEKPAATPAEPDEHNPLHMRIQ
jgi:serine/threonine-protein kinase